MRVLIYGAGAVGLGIASCLLKSGCRVCLVGRGPTVAALAKSGLSRTGIFGTFHAEPGAFGAYPALSEMPVKAWDFVLICTKSFDSGAAAQDLAGHPDRIGPEARLVLLQNGWGNAEVLAQRFEPERIYSARVITGFHRHAPNEVEITVHADAVHIGSLFSSNLSGIDALCRAISEGDLPCEPTEHIAKDLWAKMLYNCALNPLGAILKVPYGALAEQATTRELMEQIIREVFGVMAAAGYETHWPDAEGFIEAFYSRLVPDTAQHESSTLQDLTAGRRTEIDALTGAVLSLAERHDLEVPHNRAMYGLIKFAESRR